jgi:hypothetical protein
MGTENVFLNSVSETYCTLNNTSWLCLVPTGFLAILERTSSEKVRTAGGNWTRKASLAFKKGRCTYLLILHPDGLSRPVMAYVSLYTELFTGKPSLN